MRLLVRVPICSYLEPLQDRHATNSSSMRSPVSNAWATIGVGSMTETEWRCEAMYMRIYSRLYLTTGRG